MKNPFKKLKPRFVDRDEAKPFLEHLEEFRHMLMRCLTAVAVCMVICIPLAKPMLEWMKAPLLQVAEQNNYTFALVTSSPIEGFVQVMKVIFASGVLLSLPFIIYFIAQFVFPGLKPGEQKMLVYSGLAGAVLFAGGVAFCYKITLPVAVKVMFYFSNYLGTAAYWKIDAYLGFIMQLLIGFGLAFELPLILLILGHMGIISTTQMRKYRRHVVVVILIIAMILTPPDVLSQLQMAIPLYILYELCIVILSLHERRGRKEGEGTEK